MSTNVIASDHRSGNPNADLRNVYNVNSYLLNPTSNCNIGTWNAQTMYSTSKTAQIVKGMGNYHLDILGISECRWTGYGKMNTKNDKGENYTIIHSGQKDTHHMGVALMATLIAFSYYLLYLPYTFHLYYLIFQLTVMCWSKFLFHDFLFHCLNSFL